MERELAISAGRTIRQGRMGHSEEEYEEVRYQFEEPADEQSAASQHRQLVSDTPRRQEPDPRRPTPRSKDSIEVQRPSSPDRRARIPSPVGYHEQVSMTLPGLADEAAPTAI